HSDELESRRAHLHGEARELEDATAELSGHLTEGKMERTRIESRIESLLDRDMENERLESGTRELVRLKESSATETTKFNDAGSNESESTDAPVQALPPVERLGGLLADQLTTSTMYARALDVVLGDRAQALVIEDVEAAGEVIRWLKGQTLGHARLVLPRGLSRAGFIPAPNLVRMTGVQGPLLDCIDVKPGFEDLAETLLRDVLLVESVEVAAEMVALSPGLRCVTVEGDLVDAGGISGGYRDIVHGPVGRRSSAAELTGEIGEIEREARDLTGKLEQLGQRKGALQADTQVVLKALDEARLALGDARGTNESARMRLTDLEEAFEVQQTECTEIAREQEECQAALLRSRANYEELVREFEKENAQLAEFARGRRSTEVRRDELARQEAETRVESTSYNGQLEGTRRRCTDLQRGCEELLEEEQRSTELALRHAADADDGEAQFVDIDERREKFDGERVVLEAEQTEVREQDQEAREAIESHRQGSETITRDLEQEMRTLSDAKLLDQRLELAREELLRRAEEELSLSEFDLLSEFEPEEELNETEPIELLGEEVVTLKRTLDKLGSVNLEAVEELEEVTERLTFLEEQKGDITRARLALLNTLRTINEESEKLFLEAFEDIRKNFSTLFRQLFGGGRATIELAEGEPILEAGIQISARPPGREMLPLGLLSGGQRTMTALALLFAVFQSRPSPFCVLDEVDAALDDANIGRFLVLLEGFRRSTQFIVVTHNKGTMSACDMLYGITMETRGVSRNVSVELSDVDEFVPEVEGNADVAQEARAETLRAANFDDDDEDDLIEGDSTTVMAELDSDTGEPVVELIPVGDEGMQAVEADLAVEADIEAFAEDVVAESAISESAISETVIPEEAIPEEASAESAS
ncbi:MAG: chromosome segregation protein, partial [Planctomycetota bacterium]